VTTGNALHCCCDQPSAPCTTLDLENLPSTISVSINVEVEYQMSFWRREEYAYHYYVMGQGGSDGPNCDQVACSPAIQQPTVEPYAQHVATLSMTMSGEIPFSGLLVGGSARLYRGQLGFSYDFSSDFPGTASASGGLTPTSTAWPLNASAYQGIACVLSCDATAPGGGPPWARGMSRRYWGLDVAGDEDSVIASGPMLRLTTSYQLGSWFPGGGSQTPPLDESDDPLYLVGQGIGFLNQFGSYQRMQGSQKLAPLKTCWVKQSAPVAGSYEAARTASSLSDGLAIANGFSHYPRTRPLGSPTQLIAPNCPRWLGNHYGPADQDDPDYGSRQGDWFLALPCTGEDAGRLPHTHTDPDCPDFPGRPLPECPLCAWNAGYHIISQQVGLSYYPNGCNGVPPYQPQASLIRSARMRMASMTAEVS